MKNIKIFALLFGVLLLAQTNVFLQPKTLKWFTNYNEVNQQAVKANKPVLLFFHGSDWCPPCIKMQKEVFDDNVFIEFASSKILFLNVDFPYKPKLSDLLLAHNNELKKKFGLPDEFSQGYPQVVIIDPKGKVLYQEKGYNGEGPEKIKKVIKKIISENNLSRKFL